MMRKIEVTRGDVGTEKFGATWEGPYKITKLIGPRTYKLQTMEGKDLPRIWNVENLKRLFP